MPSLLGFFGRFDFTVRLGVLHHAGTGYCDRDKRMDWENPEKGYAIMSQIGVP
jgi:hypothetical protein